MATNSIDPVPPTPCPDSASHSGDESVPEPVSSPADPATAASPPSLATSSVDDLNLLLSASAPDPFLENASTGIGLNRPAPADSEFAPCAEPDAVAGFQGAPADAAEGRAFESESAAIFSVPPPSEGEFQIPVVFTPSPEPAERTEPRPASETARETPGREAGGDGPLRTSWTLLLVASYASAVTIALLWVLWSGRRLVRPTQENDSYAAGARLDSRKAGPGLPPGAVSAPLPARNLATLGIPTRLGDLEIIPEWISRRDVELVRLDGATGETRLVENVLVLSLRLTNRSRDTTFTPLDPAFVRDSNSAVDDSYIETAGGQRIPVYQLAPESEWSINDQNFPVLEPGAEAETIVVSEPVQIEQLSGPLVWHVKLRTGAYQTDVLGIRFSRDQTLDRDD